MDFPILDDHMHLDPEGLVEDAVKAFRKSGGTGLILSHKPYGYPTPSSNPQKWYEEQYGITLSLAERARGEGVKVWTVVGPYPVDLVRLVEGGLSVEEASEFLSAGVDIAEKLIEEGEAVAFGEVGRPHFPVDGAVIEACNRLLSDIMSRARRLGCAVVVHCESAEDNPALWGELAEMADSAGLDRHRVVKHFSPAVVDTEKNMGLFPSVIASGHLIEEALSQGTRFMMETDYIDDPKRPGAVLGPRTVPKRTLSLVRKGIMTEDDAWKIHHDNPEKVYGIQTL